MKRSQLPIFALLMGASLVMGFASQAQDATPETTPAVLPGASRSDSHGIKQVWVPAGCFLMGTSAEQAAALKPPAQVKFELAAEQPQHEVCLSKGYWIDQTEVTNAAFQAFVDAGGYQNTVYWSDAGQQWLKRQTIADLPVSCPNETTSDHPRVCVTWYEAEAYAHWRGGRLPTEAEWEYAARGPDSRVYPWGDDWDAAKANVVGSRGTTPVGSFPGGASWVGALDMSGNAMEWVNDWLDLQYYQQNVHDDPQGPETGTQKVEKGGWWGSNPYFARTAYRHFEDPPTYQDHHIGFRIVTEAES